MRIKKGRSGQAASEFVLILPFVLMLLLLVAGISLACSGGIIAKLGGMRAAGMAAVMEGDIASLGVMSVLQEDFFKGGIAQMKSADGSELQDNSGESLAQVIVLPKAHIKLGQLVSTGLIERSAVTMPALNAGLTDRTLQGGDTPSPYCEAERGYKVCGHPQ